MSKLDAQRAMKEAKYARYLERAQGGSVSRLRTGTTAAPASERSRRRSPGTAAAPAAATDTCGHKSMNGRACTREAGHSEKSHRYS